MINKFLCSRSGIYITISFIIIPILITLITGVCLMDYQVIFILIIPLITTILVEITNEGIARTYKKEVIHFIGWNKLTEVRFVPKYSVIFLDFHADRKDIANGYKTNVWFWLNSKNLNIMLKYKDKFKDKITNADLLGKKTKEKFI